MADFPRAEQVKICKVVAQAILADGQLSDDERALLDELMQRFELDAAERKDVFARNIDDDPAPLAVGIESAEGKNTLIVELAMAVAADGALTRAEKDLLKSVADTVGVPQDELDQLVKTALQ
jgi:uncharacterized tellurite resistance protein B-like protein